MGLTHCYKTEGFFTFITKQCQSKAVRINTTGKCKWQWMCMPF